MGTRGNVRDPAELDDNALMEWVAQGQTTALEVLYDRYASLVYSFAMRMVGDPEAARGLVERAFLAVWQRSAAFRPERDSCATWLLVLVHQLGVTEVRRRRSRRQRWEGAAGEEADDDEGPGPLPDLLTGGEHEAWVTLRRRHVREALQTLAKEQRRTLELSYFQGYTQEEIARLTGEPLTTIKSRLRSSLRRLREVLELEDARVERT